MLLSSVHEADALRPNFTEASTLLTEEKGLGFGFGTVGFILPLEFPDTGTLGVIGEELPRLF